MARSLGYEVTVAEADKNMSKIAEVVNSSDVLMGLHGAGLANILFHPENAIFIQILPVGGFEWTAANYFREPSRDMNLKYLEYKISKESILESEPQLNKKKKGDGKRV
ncbi:putative glycosyltransferase 61 [Rosa chinensis]|uniref:Putative glycosyltransferase 61 n=1 Tax=Rosa chinensis TaxID=74649 RepID=A0A2P6P217_ROSCH|nr:putative glycosyltransferase 61 [Rosa chinensis]